VGKCYYLLHHNRLNKTIILYRHSL